MKKMFLAVFLFASVFLSALTVNAKTPVAAFKASTVSEKSFMELLEVNPEAVYEKYDNVIEIQTMKIDNKNSDGVKAFKYDKNGILQELDCEVTLNKISYQEGANSISAASNDVSTVYALTAETKDSKDSTTKNGITLNGTITWIDHFGTSNELVSVSGSRSGAYKGDGTYKITSQTHGVGSGSFSSGSFSDSSNSGEKGYSFTLVIHSYTAAGDQTTLIVKTSAFD